MFRINTEEHQSILEVYELLTQINHILPWFKHKNCELSVKVFKSEEECITANSINQYCVWLNTYKRILIFEDRKEDETNFQYFTRIIENKCPFIVLNKLNLDFINLNESDIYLLRGICSMEDCKFDLQEHDDNDYKKEIDEILELLEERQLKMKDEKDKELTYGIVNEGTITVKIKEINSKKLKEELLNINPRLPWTPQHCKSQSTLKHAKYIGSECGTINGYPIYKHYFLTRGIFGLCIEYYSTVIEKYMNIVDDELIMCHELIRQDSYDKKMVISNELYDKYAK